MNPWLILAPLGMLVVGVASMVFWRRRSHAALRYFTLGGLVWGVSVAPKLLMDYTITPSISSLLTSSLGLMGGLAALGIYVGLRTGLFECGFTFLAVDKTGLKKASVDDATAFGVGFGAVEAILLALPSLIQLAMFVTNPSMIDAVPPQFREALRAQLSVPTSMVLAPILERMFTLFAHVFSALLVFAAVRRGRIRLLLYAFVYKGILDAAAPYLQWVLASSSSASVVYLVELWVVLLGALGLLGSIRLRRRWN